MLVAQSQLCVCVMLLQWYHATSTSKEIISFSCNIKSSLKTYFHCFKWILQLCFLYLDFLLNAILKDALKTDPHSPVIFKSLWNINHQGSFQKKCMPQYIPNKSVLNLACI